MSSSFDSVGLSPALLAVVRELGYETMTPIQAQGIPVLLAGKDLVGQSGTGSGKTAAFGLPILDKLDMSRREVQALVLCPTRELCAQVAREIRKLGRRHPGLQVLTVSGGEPGRPQTAALGKGVHVVVGTPGRVLDHLGRGTLALSSVATAVLDEADRMLDMGFTEDMEKILAALPTSRQTAFFSATFPRTIATMSRAHQRAAVRVTIEDDEAQTAAIRQVALITQPDDKLETLYAVLRAYPHDSALVFCNLKVRVAELVRTLRGVGVSAEALHGDLEQFDRDRVMAIFRNESVRILVATDVAAPAIDAADLDLVVNYDLPHGPEVYVHRVGRTGRAGKHGLAVSLATPADKHRLLAIENLTATSIERVKRSALGDGIELARDAKMTTLRIGGGRKDKVRPGDILGALTGEAGGLDASEVGKIEIHDHWSYVAVRRPRSSHALDSLNHGKIKGKRFRATLVDGGASSRPGQG